MSNVDYAAQWKMNPASAQVGGVVENTETGFKISNGRLETGLGVVKRLEVELEVMGDNYYANYMFYGLRNNCSEMAEGEFLSLEEFFKDLSDNAPILSNDSLLDAWNENSISVQGDNATVAENVLTVENFKWYIEETKTTDVGTLKVKTSRPSIEDRETPEDVLVDVTFVSTVNGEEYVEETVFSFAEMLSNLGRIPS